MIGVTTCTYRLEKNGAGHTGFAVVKGDNSSSLSEVVTIIDSDGTPVHSCYGYSLVPENAVLIAPQTMVMRTALGREARKIKNPSADMVKGAKIELDMETSPAHISPTGNRASGMDNLVSTILLRDILRVARVKGLSEEALNIECENIMDCRPQELSQSAATRFHIHLKSLGSNRYGDGIKDLPVRFLVEPGKTRPAGPEDEEYLKAHNKLISECPEISEDEEAQMGLFN